MTDKVAPKELLKTVNWSAFFDKVGFLLSDAQFNTLLLKNPPKNIDLVVETFTYTIMYATEITIETSQFSHKKKIPKWNNDCKTVINNKITIKPY